MSSPSLKDICTQTRRDILRMVGAVNSGHPGGALGCTEYMVALFNKVMEHTPQPFDPDGRDQDLFFLSNGHLSGRPLLRTCAHGLFSRVRTGNVP